MSQPKIVYILQQGRLHKDPHIRTVVFSEKEAVLLCKQKGFCWNKEQQLFLDFDTLDPHFITVVSAISGQFYYVPHRVDLTEEWEKLR